jgi:hypothetical protein
LAALEARFDHAVRGSRCAGGIHGNGGVMAATTCSESSVQASPNQFKIRHGLGQYAVMA